MPTIRRAMYKVLLATILLGVGCSESDSGGNAGAAGDGGAAGGSSTEIELGDEAHVVEGSDAKKADGTEAHPFATVASAVAAIETNEDWAGTLVIHEGRYEILEDVVLPIGVKLEVEAGTTMAFASLVAFHAQGDVHMLGTVAKPILMTWLTEGKHWSSLTNYEPSSQDNVFEYVIFEHGYENNFREISERGVLSLNQARALISHCTFRDNEGDDGLTLVKSESTVEHSQFLNNASDAIDQGYGYSEIGFCYFENNGNDATDLGDGSSAWVHDNVMYKNGDKAVSVGEGSHEVIVENNLCVDNAIGVAIKDDSVPIFRNNTLYGNDIGLASFASASGYGSGKGSFTGGIIWNSKTADFSFDATSETEVSYTCASTLTNQQGDPITGVGLTSPGDGCDDPMFADPDNEVPDLRDFHLRSATGRWLRAKGEPGLNIAMRTDAKPTWVKDEQSSPCIDGGDPKEDEDVISREPTPNGSRVNLGCYGGSAEASKSP